MSFVTNELAARLDTDLPFLGDDWSPNTLASLPVDMVAQVILGII